MMRLSPLGPNGPDRVIAGDSAEVAFKSTSAESLPRWATGTGQSSYLKFRSGPIARRGRGGIRSFGSASTTLSSLWADQGQNEVRPWRLYKNSHVQVVHHGAATVCGSHKELVLSDFNCCGSGCFMLIINWK